MSWLFPAAPGGVFTRWADTASAAVASGATVLRANMTSLSQPDSPLRRRIGFSVVTTMAALSTVYVLWPARERVKASSGREGATGGSGSGKSGGSSRRPKDEEWREQVLPPRRPYGDAGDGVSSSFPSSAGRVGSGRGEGGGGDDGGRCERCCRTWLCVGRAPVLTDELQLLLLSASLVLVMRGWPVLGTVWFLVCSQLIVLGRFLARRRAHRRRRQRELQTLLSSASSASSPPRSGAAGIPPSPSPSSAARTGSAASTASAAGAAPGPGLSALADKPLLPSWVTDPGWERGGGWLDGVLGQLWAPAKAAVQHLVLEKLDQAMRTSKPKMFSTLGFSHLELGSRPIRILGVKHYAGLTEESLLDVEVEFVQGEDSLVQFEVGLTALPGVAPFVIELKELVFRAELRLSLAPLLERLPVVGALSLAFTKKPDLDFRLQALRLDVMDLPFVYQGLGALLEGALSSMIWPRMLTFPFTELDARALGRIRHPPPRGVLFVRIIAAKDLTGAMESLLGWHPGLKYTTRRSCVKVRLLQDASQSFTTQLRYGVHPTYGETGELIVHEPQTAQLEFTVLREARLQDSVLSRPRVLGEATFTLESTGLLRGGTPRGDEDDSGSKGGGVPAGDGGDGSDGGSDNSNGTTGDGGDNDGSDLFQERRILRNIPLLGGSGSSGGDARPPCIDVELVWRPVAPPCPDEGRNGPAGHSSSSSRSRNGAEREAEAHDGDDDDDEEEEEEDTAQDLDPDVDAYDDDHAEEDADVDSSEDEDEGDDDDDSDDYSSCSSENSHDMYSGNDDEDDEDSDNEEGGGASGVGENLTEEEEEEDDDESSGLTAEGGVLRFKLFKCEDLPAMDSNGACDPYVKLQVREPSLRDGEPKWWRRQPTRCGPVLCSSVVRESRRPVWEPPHCFDLVVDDFDAATLQVEVWDRDVLTRDDFIGSFKLRLGDVDSQREGWLRDGLEIMEFFHLHSGTGKVFVSLEWHPFP